jgi:polar amino acid transport system substrate-binding protein
MMSRSPLSLLALACIALMLSGCSREGVRPLKVGMELAYPPFEMGDEQGKPIGVSPDLARALGAHLKREVIIENVPFDGLIPSLKTGKIDLIISSMTATPERAQSIDFSDPYLTTGLALLVSAKSDLESDAGLNSADRTIVVKKGTTGALYANEKLPLAKVLVVDKESSAVLEVAQGKADAFIYDQMSVLKNWQQHRDTTRPLLRAFQTESWAVGIRKGNDPLREKVNEFLQAFRARGGFNELASRWLGEPKEEFAERQIPFVF